MKLYWVLLLFVIACWTRRGEAQLKQLLVNCGSNSSVNVDGRKWVGDLVPGNNFTLTSAGSIGSSNSSDRDPLYGALYKTARIFNTTSSYNFSLDSGSYYLRLHFYPFSFGNFNVNESSFDVTANNLKLVSKFNVTAEILWKNAKSNSNSTSLVKEYLVGIKGKGLDLEFSPDARSVAFVNAIEVIPILDGLFADTVSKVGSNGEKNSLNLIDQGMETMYRLNVGGPKIESSKDSNLSRNWESDEKFMYVADASTMISTDSKITYSSINESSVAPLEVYETARTMTNNEVVEKKFNISWRFDVDPNFDYFIRLHFCEFVCEKANQRIFRIYINNKTAADNYDVFVHAGGKDKAYHEDFIDVIPQQIDTLWLQLGPDSNGAPGSDAFLNGLEIFKLSKNGNLAHVLSRFDTGGGANASDSKPKNKSLLAIIVIGISVTLTVIVISLGFICLYVHRKKAIHVKEQHPPGWRPLFLHGLNGSTTNARACKSPLNANGSVATVRTGKMFTLAEIKTATNSFDESLVIGTGGFGKVYKGDICGDLVAIKRAHPNSQQGLKEFETEIVMLSKLRHRHLVSMIGYCDEQNEMILVYEYMGNGTLRSHLYGSDLPPLNWKQRLEACIGAARGLYYLHTGAERGIIHRDVKTTNILLDESFVAKVADFGLSKDGPALDQTHVSTAVKGSFGYLDPEYFRRQQLTQKSDVYSFGVVLFEVVCARPVINPTLPRDQINLAEWALQWQKKRSLEAIVDPKLQGGYSVEPMKKFGEIAEKCLSDEGKDRPTMGEVLWHLEYVLQLHEAIQSGEGESFTMNELRYADNSFSMPRIKEGDEESIDGKSLELRS
ncbi:uncharacterized protein A4U43_C06F19310 [Asparagus officinalis]|uniref:Protein kinase domain-containing protein n=1 Tax=Asparagus officinalis TaxID=4686 RepID=A0A5P1ENH1_ASPOF|nr:probable receptor-like protein kinase At1g30570 [Asparagus officinalis]ONK67354.1 uncharacterized protein A4U43_C06F19310 [Asparagus officinalis]